MSGYRRFVAYVYEYRKGKKSSNCGYVKVEVRDARCTMDVHLQCAGLTPEIPCKVYSFLRKDGLMNGILLGICKTQEDVVSCTLETNVRSMGDSGIPLERMGGMIFVTEMGSFFGTEWDDEVIRPENFREIKPETSPDKATEAKEKKPGGRKPDEKKPEEHKPDGVKPDEKKPEEHKPDEHKPDALKADAHKPDVLKPDALKSDTEKPNEKKLEGQQESRTETITQKQVAEKEEPQIQFAEISKESPQAQHAEKVKAPNGIRTPENSWELMQIQETIGERTPQIQPLETAETASQIQLPETAQEQAEAADNKMVSGINRQSDSDKKEMIVTEINISEKEDDTIIQDAGKGSAKQQDTSKEDTKQQYASKESTKQQYASKGSVKQQDTTKQSAKQQDIKPESAPKKPEWEISSETEAKRIKGIQTDTKAENFPRTSPRRRPLPGEDFMPFEDEDFVWCRKIRPEDITCISRRNCALRQNRFVLYGYYNFGHLLLCRRADGKHMFGVPGGYDQQERFMANMFGFPYFKKSRYINLPNDKGGYWYRLIDAPDLD